MKQETNICIVIPCYNEEMRLALEEYHAFLHDTSHVFLCFVNDGSVDNTLQILEELRRQHRGKVEVVSYPDNVGKAEALRRGVHFCNKNYDHSFIAYLDADLSTSLQECISMTQYLKDPVEFCFGSRQKRVDSIIQRKAPRWLIGRVVASIITRILKLYVYDTQCGCKLFTKILSIQLFEHPFISKWLFDVEIFLRFVTLYGREQATEKMLEVPLTRWVDKGVSSVKMTYFFKLWVDLYQINKTYNFANNKSS
jgi:glycosyltransferase involved in cell wall biosynthesis